mgnify:CR=1 FL=1
MDSVDLLLVNHFDELGIVKLLRGELGHPLIEWVPSPIYEEEPMVPVEFLHSIAKEFTIEEGRLKMAKIIIYPGSAPMIELTVELNAQQAKALHFIKEGGKNVQEDQQVPHAEQA